MPEEQRVLVRVRPRRELEVESPAIRRSAGKLLPFGITRRAQIVELVINDAQRLCDEQCGRAEPIQRDQPAIEKTHIGFVLTTDGRG